MTLERWIRLLNRLVRLPEHLWHELEEFLDFLLASFSDHRGKPAAPFLTATPGECMSTVTLTLSLPTTMSDGTALDPTAIASVVYQKTSLTVPTNTILQTNTAVAGQGPAATDLTYVDTAPVVGDVYSAYVTDTAGDQGQVSNTYTVPGGTTTAVPGAPVLTAVYAP